MQTPKKRGAAADPGAARQRRVLYALAASGLVALGIVVVLLLVAGGGSSGTDVERVRTAAQGADCTFQSATAGARSHSITSPDGTVKWNTNPPTTGPHYEVPAVWGAYDSPLQPARWVHNLEHGGIFIQYGDEVPEATVQQLRDFYDEHQRGTLLAPLPALNDKIALGAWVTPSEAESDNGTGYLMKCTSFDEEAFTAFFEEFQFKGPERFPADTLLPGT